MFADEIRESSNVNREYSLPQLKCNASLILTLLEFFTFHDSRLTILYLAHLKNIFMADNLYDFGMVGIGVMGSNFLLNMADNGYKVIGFDLNAEKAKHLEEQASPGTIVKGVTTAEEMVAQLDKQRRIMMLVPAGK